MLILSKTGADPTEVSRYPFVADIVGNTICADLMDYLRRDHLMTGLPMGLGHRFMNNFYVMRSDHPHFKKRMVVRIARDGVHRADVVTELEKYLRFRYELTERVLTHHAKGAADAMMGKLLEMWHDQQWLDLAAAKHKTVVKKVGLADVDAFQRALAEEKPAMTKAGKEAKPGADEPLSKTNKAVAAIHENVQGKLDAEFVRRSDDGLLEHLQDLAVVAGTERMKAVGRLAKAVQDRDLYKMIGRTPVDTVSLAPLKHKSFGSAAKRRKLERDAAKYAGLKDGWKVVLWLPSPSMKLKVADVLADDGRQVNKLAEISPHGGEIVEQHRKLWAISVYASRDSVEDDVSGDGTRIAEVLLAYMRDELDVPLTRWDGKPARSRRELAADRVSDIEKLSREQSKKLQQYVTAAKTEAGGTFKHLLAETKQAALLIKAGP